MTYNVALIVLDTLREDYAQGLEALRERGFIRYKNAIAPAPWTLPSHISMLTGLYPSEHGVYYTLNTYLEGPKELARISRMKMHKYGYGVLGEFSKQGFNTYILTANPLISPYFGFKASQIVFADPGGVVEFGQVQPNSKPRDKILKLLSDMQIFKATTFALNYIKWVFDVRRKGGIHIYKHLLSEKLLSPYFVLINLMEAHAPFTRKEVIKDYMRQFRCFVETVLTRRCPSYCYYIRREYPKHAEYAVHVALKIVDILNDDNTMIIITSDHGEGLCDPAYGHGYWLDEKLYKVPLWVKYPRGVSPLEQRGKYIPLTQLPDIIRATLGERKSLGTEKVKVESFDIPYDIYTIKAVLSETDRFINDVLTYRVRYFE